MKKTLCTICLLSYFFTAHAQSWRWGQRGGSSDGTPGGPDETVVDMTTDPNGNVYVLSKVLQSGLNVAGHAKTGWGGQDIMISSFTCNGDYRWSKVIGGNAEDIPAALKTDTLGGVYVAGYLGTHLITIHLDADTSWNSGTYYKSLFIAKYDTSGNYQWFRMPEADTVGSTAPSYVRSLDMDVDGNGNIYWLCGLRPGPYGDGSFTTSSQSICVLKYNSSGTFTGGTQLSIGYSNLAYGGLLMKRDFSLNRYYITGDLGSVGSLTFSGTPITRPMFIGAFNNFGSLLWQKQNTSIYSNYFKRTAIDDQHNIYLSGSSEAFSSNPDTFNSYVVTNTVSQTGSCMLTVKLDSNGNNTWAKTGASNNATYYSSIAVNGNEIVIAGQYGGKLAWHGEDSLYQSTSGYNIYLTHFDRSTGNTLNSDTLISTAGSDFSESLVTDIRGNLYVGGSFRNDVTVNGTTLSNIGGGSDFFVAKYGYDNCTCTPPTANFSVGGTASPNFSFTYTGSTTGLDSLIWHFGDGSSASGSTATHTYSSPGTYYACVTAYTSCGSNTHCDSVVVPLGVNNLSAFPGVDVYPNPVGNSLFIAHAPAGTSVSIMNLMGQTLYNGIINNGAYTISTANMPAGTYILQLADEKGNHAAMTMMKQ